MNNNYYLHFIKEIKKLISEKKYDQAQIKLKTELDLPYIPREYEIELIKLYQEVLAEIPQVKPIIKQWDLATITAIINNPFDEEIHLVAFNFLESQNARQILKTLRDYLKNNLFSNYNKMHLLFVLKKQEVNEEFIVNKTHGQYLLNPLTIPEFHETEHSKIVKKFLEDLVYNDNPSLEQVCWYIWENYWYNQYPQLPERVQLNSLLAAIIHRAKIMQGDDEGTLLQICEELTADEALANKFLQEIASEKIF